MIDPGVGVHFISKEEFSQMLTRALYASALLSLMLLGTTPAVAEVGVGLGVGSPYYGDRYSPYGRRYFGIGQYGNGQYDDGQYGYSQYGNGQPFRRRYFGYGQYGYDQQYRLHDDTIDAESRVIEPTAAPIGCVLTNVINLKNACPRY
jgi:hypothetical protein